MMRWMVLGLVGCSTAYTAELPSEAAPIPHAFNDAVEIPEVPPKWNEPSCSQGRAEEDSAYATSLLRDGAQRFSALATEQQTEGRAAASELLANCPYTRARVMAWMVMDARLSGLEPTGLSGAEREAFELLVAGARAQADVVRALGADALPLPMPGDHLVAFQGRLVDGAVFASSDDPLALAHEAVGLIDDSLYSMDQATRDRIEASWVVLRREISPTVSRTFDDAHRTHELGRLVKEAPDYEHVDVLAELFQLMSELQARGC